ncbi:MAG TPA: GDSL-type esterase/lipase family protein [Stellaceae bacterium]|jgi:lysophospholipase L1-like esterase|nr:GDSL-type esterase/lipase family protein [Stellaceae bacterium]
MSFARAVAALCVGFVVLCGIAQAQVRCRPFTAAPIAAPEQHAHPLAQAQFDRIKIAVKTEPYRVLYLGDSITQYWDPKVWAANMAPRGVLNAGVAGDRTEHLRWRLDHGNLAGPPPKGVVLLIGTNDLGHGRAPAEAAEGIRASLIDLRDKLPDTRILLLGLWPRGATPADRLRQEAGQVNRLIRTCADNKAVLYADIGGVLLDAHGTLPRELSPDLLHFSAAGYQKLAPQLDPLIDRLVER